MKVIYKCIRCNKPVTKSKKFVSQGYFAACLRCDEDLYKFETKKEQA